MANINLLSIFDVPSIPENLTLDQLHLLIPQGFENIIETSIDIDSLNIKLLNDENEALASVVSIPKSLYNPLNSGTFFPKYLFELSTLNVKDFDPFGKHNRCIFNQNELIYLCLHHRLTQLSSHKRAFSGLIDSDIKAIRSSISYKQPKAYNSALKVNNSYIVLSPWIKRKGFKQDPSNPSFKFLMGDILKYKAYLPNPDEWRIIKNDLPIHASSESSLSSSGKIVLSPFVDSMGKLTTLYRSIGHQVIDSYGTFTSIFPSASNIAARLKTHVTAEAYELVNFEPTSQFIQDYIYDEDAGGYANGSEHLSETTRRGGYVAKDSCHANANEHPQNPLGVYLPKDSCYVKAITVIAPFGTDINNTRFLYGEIECSTDISSQTVWDDKNVSCQFEEVGLTIGERVHLKNGKVQIGIDIDMNPVYIHNEYHHTSKYNNSEKELGSNVTPTSIFMRGVKSIVLNRVTSIGTQGVQKLSLSIERVVGNCRLDSNTGLKGVTKTKPYLGKIVLEDGTIIKPDLVIGMNAFKAKGNGIVLARAALASDLGTYKTQHFSGLLNTCNAKEINDASESLPTYTYYDEFGKEQSVQIGITYVRFTEIGEVYKSYRPRTLTHETGRNLSTNSNHELCDFLYDKYVEKDTKEIVVELQNILLDTGSNLLPDNIKERIPTYLALDIFKGKVFKESDLVLRTNLTTASTSKLLDEEWNSKGFYLDFRPQGGPKIRFPSAKLFNRFVSELETKNWLYPSLLVVTSKIIKACLNQGEGMQLGFIFNKNLPNGLKSERLTLQKAYLSNVKSILYSDEDAAQMMIQCLTKPKVPGIAMKQVVDYLLPDNTVVCMDEKLFNRVADNVFGEDAPLHLLMHNLKGFHVRSPSLWDSQYSPLNIWTQSDLEVFLWSKYQISLSKYLDLDMNKDVWFFSSNILNNQHSDVDGDYSVVYIPESLEGQELLRNAPELPICQKELDWHRDYIQGEWSANKTLIDEEGKLVQHVYKLHTVSLDDVKNGRTVQKGYTNYLINSLQSKSHIGVSTNDSWVFAMLLECYQQAYKDGEGKYQVNENSNVKTMRRITEQEFREILFMYKQALQDFVVSGVKHND